MSDAVLSTKATGNPAFPLQMLSVDEWIPFPGFFSLCSLSPLWVQAILPRAGFKQKEGNKQAIDFLFFGTNCPVTKPKHSSSKLDILYSTGSCSIESLTDKGLCTNLLIMIFKLEML